jgi:ArsR family transcriptional regulator
MNHAGIQNGNNPQEDSSPFCCSVEVFRVYRNHFPETCHEYVTWTSFFLDKISDDQYIPSWKYIGDAMREFIKVLKALSDPNRVKLVKLLQKEEICVCKLQAALGIAQPTVSKHLKILEDAGLVSRRKEGLWAHYSLTDGGRSPYAASLLGNLRHWLDDDPEVRDLIEKSEAIRREDLCDTHV